jgi:outer membrane protein assembly factor BamB
MRPARHHASLVVGTILAGAVAAGGVARADDWPGLGLDAARSRLAQERSGATFSDGRWTYAPHGARVLSSPVVGDGFVASVDLEGNVSVLRADSGAVAWRAAAGSGVQATPAIAGGRLYVPTLGNKLRAFALADGAALWSTDLGGMTVSSPATVEADLIVAAGFPQRRLIRVNGATGAIVWQSAPVLDPLTNSSPAVGGGLVVVGSNGGHYRAFDVVTGALRWEYQADGVVHLASPLIAGGRVYMAGGDDSGRVHAVDAATGTPVAGWPIELPAPDPDLDGTKMDRHRAISSIVSAAGQVVLVTRLDDSLDTDADGAPDHFLSRESAIALDPASGRVAWQQPLGRAVFTDPNAIPKFFVCPTPAGFATDGAGALLAVASSVAPDLFVLDAATGEVQSDQPVAGPALASPVLANGRVVTVAFSGAVDALLSGTNHPPSAPVAAANPQPLDATDVTLRWASAMDPDGEQPTYELRIDTDGEVLQSYAQRLIPAPGATSLAIPGPLQSGVTYTFSLRARDSHGAYSGWSAPETFTVVASPAVTVNGVPAANLRAAIAGAQAGDAIMLGAGTYPLATTLHVAGGVTISGAGASRTILDGTGLPVGISFGQTDPKSPTGLDRATVTGAATCISVEGTAAGVELTHLVAHDCATAGIAVAAGGAAAVVNATLTADGVALDVAGSATIKNSIVSTNQTGLRATGSGTLTGSYDDLFGNQTDRQGVTAGTGDLSAVVAFANAAAHDYRLVGPQPSTDRGDPADAVGDEPTPNGGRINLGAFGGTGDAELSTLAPITSDPPRLPIPTGLGGGPGRIDEGGGCGMTGRAPRFGSLVLTAAGLALALVRRRRRST